MRRASQLFLVWLCLAGSTRAQETQQSVQRDVGLGRDEHVVFVRSYGRPIDGGNRWDLRVAGRIWKGNHLRFGHNPRRRDTLLTPDVVFHLPPFTASYLHKAYGSADHRGYPGDAESPRAGIERGVTSFDAAEVYGALLIAAKAGCLFRFSRGFVKHHEPPASVFCARIFGA